MSILHLAEQGGSPPSGAADIELIKANAAHARAMPMSRMLDYGMSYADATALHRLAADGLGWIQAAEWLGDRNRRRAEAAATTHARSLALMAACACYRFAQSALDRDTAERKRLYRLVVDSFAEAVGLLPSTPEKVEFQTGSGWVGGWLFHPAGTAGTVVVIIGGADGWREAYYPQGSALQAEGLAVLLLDGPGQGESRLFHGTWLTRDIGADLDSVAAELKKRFARVGIWGNSLGGSLAALAAASGTSLDAVCSNSGSAQPSEAGEKFPRFLDKIAAMMGSTDRAQGAEMLARLDLSERLPVLSCPLLVLHGGNDTLFSQQNVQKLHDLAGSSDRTMLVWDDGEHCLYSYAAERNAIVASWFRSKLENEGGMQ